MIERLTGASRPYAWGSRSFIPDLLGQPPTDEPVAELWLGAHPTAPATIAGESLGSIIDRDPPGMLGVASVAEFGPHLPFLLKVLAADQPLSLQAHPTRAQAEAGFEREEVTGIPADSPNRLYSDRWPKPELLCALVESEALCGFREPAETYELFVQLGVAQAVGIISPLQDPAKDPAERLSTVFATALRLSGDDVAVISDVVRAAQGVPEGGPFGDFARTARELGVDYSSDPGLLAALLMKRVRLQPLDALYLPAGNLHAYLHGAGIEIMASSNNVLRGGLTPKHVDVDELLRIVDFRPGPDPVVRATAVTPGVWRYRTPAPEFGLWRVEAGGSEVDLPGDESGRVVLVVGGSVELASGAHRLTLERGQAAFVGADEHVRVSGSGTAFLGGPGLAQ